MQVPLPQSLSLEQKVALQSLSAGVRHFSILSAHLEGSVSGMSPQQSERSAHWMAAHSLPVPSMPKSEGWQERSRQGVVLPQSTAVVRQARPALQSLEESQVAPRSLGPELGEGAQARAISADVEARR